MDRGEDIVQPLSWRIGGRLVEPRFPMVMGILNVTPDSFHAASRVDPNEALREAEAMLKAGAPILDLGGASTRPGAQEIPIEEELERVIPAIGSINREFPEALISIDTYRSQVAKAAVEAGAGMVNDIGAGLLDPAMLETVAKLNVPYVLMHMQGTPRTMQKDPQYADVVKEVVLFLSQRLNAARAAGIADVIVDPGFGFGKNTDHNFQLLKGIASIRMLGVPMLIGLSRKRMINEVLGTTPAQALNGTSILNTIALLNGAHILRVHDVKEAVECVKLIERYRSI